MLKRPSRPSIVGATAEAISDSIRSGEWKQFLPGERELSKQLQVGRSTLRKAIALLRREGVLGVSHGRRTTILEGKKDPKLARARAVAALVKGSPEEIDSLTARRLNDLQHDLYNAGIMFDIYFVGSEIHGSPRHHIEKLLATCNVDCWAVFAGNRHIQEVFKENAIDSVIVGDVYPDIDLPHIDIDFKAACRHAVGHLLGLGHRSLVYFVVNANFPGTQAATKGFWEGVTNHTDGKVSARVVEFNEGIRNASSLIKGIVKDSSISNAFLVGSAELSLMTLTTLLAAGLSVPNDISLICRDYRPFLQFTNPPVSSYSVNHDTFRKKLTTRILELVNFGRVSAKSTLVVPEFRKGKSVAPPRAEGGRERPDEMYR